MSVFRAYDFEPDEDVNDGTTNTPKRRRFTLTRFKEVLMSSSAAYLVKGLIPRAGLVVVWGPPKCGKSFWTFDLAMHVALDKPYRGRRVHQGAVVYLALEGGHGFRARIEAYRREHGVTDAPFYLVTDRTNLVRDHRTLIDAIRADAAAPVLVCIDTLNRSLAGSESKDEDMADYIRAADAIREIFDCAVVIVHHCGIDGTRPRGHTSLTGAADAQHAISRDAANNIITIVEWMKDGPEGDTIVSRLKPVDLGCDEDGEPISSCVVVPVEGGLAREARKKPTKMPKAAQIALRALAEAVDEQGQTPPASAHIPAGVRAVSVPVWREQCYRRGICTTEGDRAKRQAFKRASEHLIGSSSIGIWDDLAWLAR